MSLNELWDWIQNTELSFQIGATYWFPLLESIHVLGIVFLVGSILVVDLRLLGITAVDHLFSTLHKELTRWTWTSFVVATLTGVGLFISRPGAYAENPAFQIKFALLICAGVNVWLFRRIPFASIGSWDASAAIPRSARLAGFFSMILWAGVIFAGRWVGHIM
jgi:hypothetical protein